ncbi:hypothetical protein DL96DRAFT_1615328 [Flagelloscypha sp. PMI_526]|nr:hypothetical protein DL96DRAFT_1615328 [Flagelloscypha sp. PMI_526]
MSTTVSPSVVDLIGYGVFHVFQVESTLFKIPIEHFSEHVQFFKMLLSFPDKSTSTDDDPIQISDTSTETFVSVLEWLYRLPFSLSLDKEAWIKIFRFAQAYQMEQLQKESLDALNTFDWVPIEHVSFCERYSIEISWAASSLAKLASCWDPLSTDEESVLEQETIIFIMRLREDAIKGNWRTKSGASLGSWPPSLSYAASDVLRQIKSYPLSRRLSSRRSQGLHDHFGTEHSGATRDEAPAQQEKNNEVRVVQRHARFYLVEDSIHLSNDTTSLRAHSGIILLHTTKQLTESDTLFVSPTGILCLRWIYRKVEFTNSTPDEWVDVLQFAHAASTPYLKECAVKALQNAPLDPFRKIRLREDCQIPLEWAKTAIDEIAASESKFQANKFDEFSKDTLLLLIESREESLFTRIDTLTAPVNDRGDGWGSGWGSKPVTKTKGKLVRI